MPKVPAFCSTQLYTQSEFSARILACNYNKINLDFTNCNYNYNYKQLQLGHL